MPQHYQACFDVQTRACVCPIGNRAAAARAVASEMETLLRELEDGVLYDREGEIAVKGCQYQIECPGAPADDVNHEDRPCWRCRRRALLERLDKVVT